MGVQKNTKQKKKVISKKSVVTPKNDLELNVSGQKIRLTHLNKIYWPKEKITKGALIDYYRSVAKLILPYLKDRPQNLHRFPNGIEEQGFYQKDMDNNDLPTWMQTEEIYSESTDKYINYLLCQDEATLLYMINMGCIEISPWSSRKQQLNNPDWVVIDLDPGENTFKQVVKVALAIRKVFTEINIDCYCKTSGATGLHIFAPLNAEYHYDEVRGFAELIANLVNRRLPDLTSIERNPVKRKSKIYLDFLQNGRGQTLTAPYCVRPRPKATVSTPLKWSEVNADLDPRYFTIFNTLNRVSKVGDLWKPVLEKGFNMKKALNNLLKLK
jgi:bifunctional non-homologous end joining protein LigD